MNYTDILRKHDLKVTPQRVAIAEALCEYGHLNIETLYQMMIKRFNSLSQATIYKNINLMLENNFIQEVKIPNNKTVYELTKQNHSHLVCNNCGNVSDIDIELDNIVKSISQKSDFQIEKANLILSGLCKKCQ